MPDFASRLAFAMKRAGFSQKKLEEKAELSDGYISRLLKPRGKQQRPGQDLIDRLAKALRVDPGWLGRGEGSPELPIPGLSRVSPEHYPEPIAKILAADPPFGRKGAWLELTVQQLCQSYGYLGGDRTEEDWIKLGEQYNASNMAALAGKPPKTADAHRVKADPGLALEAEVEAKRLAAKKAREAKAKKP